jgi:membrane-associated phospholipid phosphatase
MKNYILHLSRLTLIIVPILSSVSSNAQQDTSKRKIADTIKKDLTTAPDTVKKLHSKKPALLVPAALFAYGASTFVVDPLRDFDKNIYTEAKSHNFVVKSNVENYIQFAPVIMTYGLNLVGIHGKNTFVDRTALLILSEGIAGITALSLKHVTHRLRPNGADYYSFPSGHTTNAFAEAEFMAQEMGDKSPWYTAVGYGFATTTGIFRIYHQDHWFSDVVAGAGIGILSTKAAYLLYPYIRNHLFKKAKTSHAGIDVPSKKNIVRSSTLLLPSYENGFAGLHFTMDF